MSANFSIYTGHVWKDYGDGKLILTLSGSAAGALEAAIPLFIALVGPVTWIFFKYPFFLTIANAPNTATAYYPLYTRQREVLLRNSAGDLGTVSDAIDQFMSWRKSGFRRPPRRSCCLVVLSLLFWVSWQVAGIVSFYIWQTTVPTVGLIRSSACGYNYMDGPAAELPFRRIGLSQTILSETYVSQCYGNSTSDSGACGLYSSPKLNIEDGDADCPFQSPDICVSTNSTPYQLDSGHINSQFDLGVNAPKRDRVTYRKVTTCSPIHSAKFAQVVLANETDEVAIWPPDTKLQQFYYGPVSDSNASYTFEYSSWAPGDGFGYDISGETYNPGPPGESFIQSWIPNSTFTSRTDADVTILFLTPNHIIYNDSVYDPFFLTGLNYTITANNEGFTYFLPASYVNTMGCIDQHQLCNPNNPPSTACTSLMAYNQLVDAVYTIDYNPTQLASAQRIITNLPMTNTFNSVNGRGAAALLASQTVGENLQTKLLPVDQWRLEVRNWFAVSLAKLQQGVVDFAAGPSDPNLLQYILYPVDPWTAKLCNNMLVQLPPGYTNFDFDGIIIVTLVGFAFGLLGYQYEKLAEWYQKTKGKDGWKRWAAAGPFQLQRLAFQGHGVTGWEDEDDDFPTTKENLPILPIRSPNGVAPPTTPSQQPPIQPPAQTLPASPSSQQAATPHSNSGSSGPGAGPTSAPSTGPASGSINNTSP